MLILRHNTLSAEDLFTIECVSFFFFRMAAIFFLLISTLLENDQGS
jgi:hypothetical protein